MTNTEKASAIKRLNERLTDMARTFGVDSSIYKEYLNSIRLTVGADNMHIPAKTPPKPGKKLTAANMGVPLITRGKDTYSALDDEKIEALLSHHTAGEVKREIKEEARRESEESGEVITPEEMLQTWENVYDTINEAPDEFYDAVTMYWYYAGRGASKPTYQLINDIIEGQDKADYEYEFGNRETAYNIRSGIRQRISNFASKQVQRYFT